MITTGSNGLVCPTTVFMETLAPLMFGSAWPNYARRPFLMRPGR